MRHLLIVPRTPPVQSVQSAQRPRGLKPGRALQCCCRRVLYTGAHCHASAHRRTLSRVCTPAHTVMRLHTGAYCYASAHRRILSCVCTPAQRGGARPCDGGASRSSGWSSRVFAVLGAFEPLCVCFPFARWRATWSAAGGSRSFFRSSRSTGPSTSSSAVRTVEYR